MTLHFKKINGLEVEEAMAYMLNQPMHTLDAEDRAFIRARESYLTEDQKEVYAKILKEVPVMEVVYSEDEESPAKKEKKS